MRPALQAITTDDLDGLSELTGRQVWDAMSGLCPSITIQQKTKVFNTLLNERAKGKATVFTLRELYQVASEHYGREIVYLGKSGVFGDIGWWGSTQTYHFTIDNKIFGGKENDTVTIYVPNEPAEVEEKQYKQIVDSVLVAVPHLFSYREQYFGKTVEMPDDLMTQGVFTDMRVLPAGPAANQPVYSLVVGGKIFLLLGTDTVPVWHE